MFELEKKQNSLYKNYYEGFNPNTQKHVICVLDDNKVFFLVYQGRTRTTHPYNNNLKEICFKEATTELNKDWYKAI